MGNTININGKNYPNGSSIIISNNTILIDGVNVTPDAKTISISVEGDLGELSCDVSEKVIVTGNVLNNVKLTNGKIEVGGFIAGSVSNTNGNIECNDVGGNVKTTNGNIKYKK